MKKLFLIGAIICMITACNFNGNTETTEEPIVIDSIETVIDSTEIVENDSIVDFKEVIDSIVDDTILE